MNLLGNETSPYLRQHMHNPVAWMPWNAVALEKARRENKPILLSIGYSACHWCHVMAHESFEDAATADLMNRYFINIKVDREERPDLDAVFQSALALMGKAGGWPLTMFLTPDAKPFWGGTYFPPQPRHGMPSFREVLRGVAESYEHDKNKIAHNTQSLAAALDKIHHNQQGILPHREQLDKISHYFLNLIDPAHGGIGTAPKFPNLTIMNLLWDSYLRTGDNAYKFAVIHSLTQMCQGGIYDHIGGGFSRYAVDEEWLAPHFEKMLYDNALFIALLTEVCKETQHPLFARRIRETIDWVGAELMVKNLSASAFAASLDADSEGGEGKYYVWTEDEIDKTLGPDAGAFKKTYDVTKFGNWEKVNILNRLKNPDYLTEPEEVQLDSWRKKLKATRNKRPAPARDNKVLADWNGLMIAALAKAGAAFSRPEWVEMAASAFRFVTAYMMDKDGHLHHVWCDGKTQSAALLEDYACMLEAALALHDAAPDPQFLTQAAVWVDILDKEFWDRQHHGYFMTAASVTDVPLRPKSAHDSAVPSGNSVMIGVLTRLYYLTGNAAHLNQAEKTAAAFSGEVLHQVFPFATLLKNCDFFLNPLCVMIAAGADNPKAFDSMLQKISLPFLIKMNIARDSIFPQDHPAFGKIPVEGKTTAYVCFGRRCLPPVTDPQNLEQLLREERSKQGRPAANDG
ncbi:MAG: thioredoxin domain-containing protein [Alphaproteobacteria bacterium]|nr:thioredoxin domain-containing protein [Alphaproteobacteria bacterium]